MVSIVRSKDDLSTRIGLSNICMRVCKYDLLEFEDARLADLIDGVSIIANNCQARHEHPEFLRSGRESSSTSYQSSNKIQHSR